MKYATLLLALSLWPAAAWAALTEQQIREVALAPPPGARVPTALVFTDLQGSELTLGGAMAGRPTLLLPADFTCTEICGPALSITASALSQTGLEAGRDYSLVVVGIDANDGTADARRFAADQIGGPGVSVLTGDADAIRSLMTAIGYHSQRDAANDAIAHPAGFVTLTSDGRVSRVLSSLALQPIDLRLALVEAGEGRIGGLTGRLALLCYGFDAVHGIYSARIATVLRIGGGLTVAALAAGLGLMLWRTSKTRSIGVNPIFTLPEASTHAERVDHIFYGLLLLSGSTMLVVFAFIVILAIRYRRGSAAKRGPLPEFVSREFEIGWTSATLFLFAFLFWWAASADLKSLAAPAGALEIHVVAKQWMWKTQHPNGAREIDELHVPIDTPVRLVMTSQDVIHSFFVPAFRMKQDVVPGRYTETWFKATKTRRISICSAPSTAAPIIRRMRGRIVVMSQEDYGRWLSASRRATISPTRAPTLRRTRLLRLSRGSLEGPRTQASRSLRSSCAACGRPSGHGRRRLYLRDSMLHAETRHHRRL